MMKAKECGNCIHIEREAYSIKGYCPLYKENVKEHYTTDDMHCDYFEEEG